MRVLWLVIICGGDMANTLITTKQLHSSINAIFDEVYSQHEVGFLEYRLEQCGKQYRVKRMWGASTEYKTGWLPLKEAQGILKLLKGNEEND
jgi:hypothetical protein